MHAIIGLGNPGSEYEGTRHNLGFDVVDALCRRLRVGFRAGKGEYLVAQSSYRGTSLTLVKPLTYMNNSGIAVQDIVERFTEGCESLLVVCDDFQLPFGKIRIRPKGSDGGHNGLYSIIYHLQRHDFPRLRCGIATEAMPKRKTEMAQFVLSPFAKEESSAVADMIDRAADAALTFVHEGIEAAMNRFNT